MFPVEQTTFFPSAVRVTIIKRHPGWFVDVVWIFPLLDVGFSAPVRNEWIFRRDRCIRQKKIIINFRYWFVSAVMDSIRVMEACVAQVSQRLLPFDTGPCPRQQVIDVTFFFARRSVLRCFPGFVPFLYSFSRRFFGK